MSTEWHSESQGIVGNEVESVPQDQEQLWLLCWGAPSRDELRVSSHERVVSQYRVRPLIGLSGVWVERIVGFVLDLPPRAQKDPARQCIATLTTNWSGSNASEWTGLSQDQSAIAPPGKHFQN